MGIEEDIEFENFCQIVQKITYQQYCVDGILKILWFIGFITMIGLVIAMFLVERPLMLVGAFAILIAAFTASFSVMSSIMHSTLMEEEKRLEEIKKYKNYVLQLLFNLQDLLSKLNIELEALSRNEPLAHKNEDVNQLLIRYRKIFEYLESENTLIHLDSEEIKIIFDLIEGSNKWLKIVNIFLDMPEKKVNLKDEVNGYTSYYLHLERLIPEAKKLLAKGLN